MIGAVFFLICSVPLQVRAIPLLAYAYRLHRHRHGEDRQEDERRSRSRERSLVPEHELAKLIGRARPPRENRLAVAIPAGERLSGAHK